MKRTWRLLLGLILSLPLLSSCLVNKEPQPRLVMFIGVDISGSFINSPNFENAVDFLGPYLYAHLNGLGGLEKPHSLFVSSIGGFRPNEPKSMFPIDLFRDKSVEEIQAKLREIFPKTKVNAYTDYNAFFRHVANTIQNNKLVLKPVSVVMISDGVLDMPAQKGRRFDLRRIDLLPLESLSRNITLRLLYTDAVTGAAWQGQIPRRRVKMWTQDAEVMQTWKEPKLFVEGVPMEQQGKYFDWVKRNVDFGVRAKRVK